MSVEVTTALRDKITKIDWNFTTTETDYLTHNIHRYSGKYIPPIARCALELISDEGDTVLDPYVGSGTTLLEANLLNRHSIGVDINPLAILIAAVKTTPISDAKLNELQKYFTKIYSTIELNESKQTTLLSKENQQFSKCFNSSKYIEDKWFQKWFSPPILRKLVILHYHIKHYKDADCSRLALLSFSNILRRCSNAHSGYPNVMFDGKKVNTVNVNRLFMKSLKTTCDMVKTLSGVIGPANINIHIGDAQKLQLEDETIDAIITHPPYIGSVPYAEYGLLSLKWLGVDPRKLDEKITGGRRQSKTVVERFRNDYGKMLSECYRVLKPGKKLFLMVGNPKVKGSVIDLVQMTEDLAHEAGFQIICKTFRTGMNRRANKMGAETLLFFSR